MRSRVGVLLLLLAFAPPLRADEARAIAATLEGDRALAAKDLATAEARYRAGVEADAGHLPAWQGLGEALHLLGRRKEAREALRRVDRGAGATEDLTGDLRRRLESARARLAEIDPGGQALAALFRSHADAVSALGERQKDADPDLADRAAGVALALVPGHAKAQALRTLLADRGLRREALFDGKQIADWDGGRSEWWKVVEGTIVADAKDVATYVRTEKTVEGDFDVLMEARLVEAYGDSSFFALMGAWTAEYEHSRLGVLDDTLQGLEYRGTSDSERVFREPVAKLARPLDSKAWNVYEIRYRGARAEAWVNGRKVAGSDRPAARKGGFVGLLAQDCRVEVRRVEAVRR